MTKYYYSESDDSNFSVSATITAQNQFTEESEFDPSKDVAIVVSGTFSATVTLQRSIDNGGTWQDIWNTPDPTYKGLKILERKALYRLGVKTGEFTSGTVNASLTQWIGG
ncbi:MAG: hypothetical protein K2X29_05405 [Candidatus Obscuribacterales bacterium]|nr:hypothetical protein [Candidatus Obscuribacterales bacterium]